MLSAFSNQVFGCNIYNIIGLVGIWIFLDTEVQKVIVGPDTAMYKTKIHTKPTSQWQPLSSTSFHPAHIHLAWPRSQFQRFRNRCTDPRDAEQHCRRLLEAVHERCPSLRFDDISMPRPRQPKQKRSKAKRIPIVVPHKGPMVSC